MATVAASPVGDETAISADPNSAEPNTTSESAVATTVASTTTRKISATAPTVSLADVFSRVSGTPPSDASLAEIKVRADLPVSRWWWQVDQPTQFAVDLTPADLAVAYDDVVGRLLASGWTEDQTPTLWQVGEDRIRLRKGNEVVQVILDSKPVSGPAAVRVNVVREGSALAPTGVPSWVPADIPLPPGADLRGVSVTENPKLAQITYRWTGPATPVLQAWGAQAVALGWYGSEQLTGLNVPPGRSSWYFQLVNVTDPVRVVEIQLDLTDGVQTATVKVAG